MSAKGRFGTICDVSRLRPLTGGERRPRLRSGAWHRWSSIGGRRNCRRCRRAARRMSKNFGNGSSTSTTTRARTSRSGSMCGRSSPCRSCVRSAASKRRRARRLRADHPSGGARLEAKIDIGDGPRKLYGFIMTLSHSRYSAVVWSRSMDQLAWHHVQKNRASRRLYGGLLRALQAPPASRSGYRHPRSRRLKIIAFTALAFSKSFSTFPVQGSDSTKKRIPFSPTLCAVSC